MLESSKSAVSIILPTYNRAKFLPEAFAAIAGQQWTDWELIVVDDGSSDNTRELVPELTAGWKQPVRYIYQENQGAYGARNTGLDHASGKYIAFYDSDDLWLPHHLKDCVEALNANTDVDWVYGACRMVNFTTGQEITPSTFYINGQPRPFLRLSSQSRGKLHVIVDTKAATCQVLRGLYNGLQNSVIRQSLFNQYRFEAKARNEAEDQLIVVLALIEGRRIAYLDQVHVEYRVHDSNSSAASNDMAIEKKARVLRLLAEGYERMLTLPGIPGNVRKAIRQRLGREYFWHLGYSTLWQAGRQRDALSMFHRGLGHWPWDWRCWKTFAIAQLKRFVSPAA